MKKPEELSVDSLIVQVDTVKRNDSDKQAIVVHLRNGLALITSDKATGANALEAGKVLSGKYQVCLGGKTEYVDEDGTVKQHERDSLRLTSFASFEPTMEDKLNRIDVISQLSEAAQVAFVNNLFAQPSA